MKKAYVRISLVIEGEDSAWISQSAEIGPIYTSTGVHAWVSHHAGSVMAGFIESVVKDQAAVDEAIL